MKAIISYIIGILSTNTLADYTLNMTKGVTSISREIYNLHMMVFWVCVAIAIIVFGVMFYSIFAHRKSKGVKASNFHESTLVEITWTLIPIVILVVMAIPASLALINLENTEKADMVVKITGHQWKWQYDYPQEDISFISNLKQSSKDAIAFPDKVKPENYLLEVDNRLVLPIDTRIRFLITSSDVIHSWWVPALGVKQDANPGFINDAWAQIDKIGIYRGQCAELCGKNHGFMPVVIEAVTKEDYKSWVNKQKEITEIAVESAKKIWTPDDLIAQGEKIYNTNCSACHGLNGIATIPVFPNMKNSKVANSDITNHINIVLNGKAGTAMAAYKKLLNDVDLAAVISYERNAFDNNGGIVQPADIKSAR